MNPQQTERLLFLLERYVTATERSVELQADTWRRMIENQQRMATAQEDVLRLDEEFNRLVAERQKAKP